ncbi:protoporphyrinogen oxidase [Melioribacter roseus P3M-2]|uniref:Coproporphyrinogen III oxidase n=1 Tax=Melioribacter roseus (strain DSM 23840 / JCM 17771 / VKM B-2668 / P3M-2) TaxID=1191523 RepID=I6ZXR8_MELRP|nr:protoporphyrinogen oxidase [Melioribacter roseus]AFN73848.1 protoporphyrinogen oxidase [Melioribacter roseus P3M-2]
MSKKIVVLGAGISGLSTAYWLVKKGYDVTILETKNEPGGSMISRRLDNFLIDYGPNSGLETTPLIRKLVEEVNLSDKMIYANAAASKRYILKNGELIPLPMSPGSFIRTKLFSSGAKFRLMAEPFVSKSDDGYYQSIAEFVRRRLGNEFLDYAIDPFVSGVFAGDPEKLSVKSAFPKLYRLEEVYGGLIKGMIKGARERKQRNEESKQSAKMFSFLEGMQSLPNAIADKLKDNIVFSAKVLNVTGANDKQWKVTYELNGNRESITADTVISTLPAYIAAGVFGELDQKLAERLNSIYYPPVMVLYLGYNKKDIKRKLDGFGFLIPSKEKKHFLGAIWSSSIFPGRSPEDMAAFTLFVGGARSPQLFEMEKSDLIKKVLSEFHQIMNIKGEPVLIENKLWQKAIPQYNLGYIEHEKYFEVFEENHRGIYLRGNYRGGISVGDCIKNSELEIK